MNEENKAVELTDEDLKQVSGGVVGEWEGQDRVNVFECPGDCNGTKKSNRTCKVSYCPHHYRGDGTLS